MLIDYDSPVSWPLEVTTFLEANRAVLDDRLTDPSVVEAAIPIADFTDNLGLEIHVAAQHCAWRAKRPYVGVAHDRSSLWPPRAFGES
ncbi:hypothetical protein K426_27775 (plasmid) [Sphingobium sp. TKS]|uniref:Uncharacterized protein n=1 Tax=Sphingomonas sp. NS2 TaxID=908605 RepID=A0A0D4ZYV1_9SPHN|nr:hypothetical protein plasmid201_022 [Sphingomonas sp. NS2]AMK26454.1 hypothetical protein K426_27775 [Sphingobium sp. TKS]